VAPFNAVLQSSYDVRLVALSYLVAILASYAALDLAGRVTATHGRARRLWLAGGAITMGLGIWTMHFTGMLAFQLSMPMRYDTPLVVLSFLIAIAASGFALFMASRPTLTLPTLLGGGLCLGLGIAAMHYTGMAAMDVDGAIHYRPLIVGASLLIAISASVVALWLAFHLRSMQGSVGSWIARKLGSAGVMGTAIVGMHYTGMAAATFTTTHTGHVMEALDTSTFTLAIALSVATLIILSVALLSALVDRRFSTQTATFESLFLHSIDAILACELDGTLRRANPAAAQLIGERLEDLSARPLDGLLEATDRARLDAQMQAAAHGEPQQGEYTLLSSTGQQVIVHATMVPIIVGEQITGVYAIIRNITARRQAEDALSSQHTRYERLLRGLSDLGEGMIIIDGRRMVFANDALCRMSGYTEDELLAFSSTLELVAPESRAATAQRIAQINTGSNDGRFESVILHKDGHRIPVESASQIMQAEGRQQRITLLRDITERKQAEAELAAANAELARAAQTATELAAVAESANHAKSAFLANMSHEIRTPMNGVIGMTGLLLDTPLTPAQHEFVTTIRSSGDALLTIINDILDFSKIESGKLDLEQQPFDLRDCVESALDLLAPRASEKGLDLAYLIDEAVPTTLCGDVTRLRQILVNLLSNAVKFTNAGEVVVTVSAEYGPDQRHTVQIAVRDTGIGIPADRMGRLFRAFSQADASTTRHYGGTGLGLAISKRLSEMMGGTMWVASAPGAGSTFSFTFVAAAAASQPRVYLRGAVPQLTGKRLLIVDDNATNRRILALQAQSWGMLVQTAEGGPAALDGLRRGETFDLGVLDMQMPGMDGVALASAIRALPGTQQLPLILLTSLGRRAEDDEAGLFAATLTKPTKASQLYDTLIGLVDLAVRQRPSQVQQAPLDVSMGERLPLRLLLAEDNLVNQKVALATLARLGYRADVAGNGLEVLEALRRQSYDVVLMDVQMPELDGLEATRRICRDEPSSTRPHIIAMTANAMQGDRELCLAAGMDDYISKPVRLEELVDALKRAARVYYPPHTQADVSMAEPAAPILDRRVLERFQVDIGDDSPAFLIELIELFLADAPQLLAKLQGAVADHIAEVVQRVAHTLKSTSASVGAKALAAECGTLEDLARDEQLEDGVEQLRLITTTFDETERALRALRAEFALQPA
jgi:PAS domain S-box-containing protein